MMMMMMTTMMMMMMYCSIPRHAYAYLDAMKSFRSPTKSTIESRRNDAHTRDTSLLQTDRDLCIVRRRSRHSNKVFSRGLDNKLCRLGTCCRCNHCRHLETHRLNTH